MVMNIDEMLKWARTHHWTFLGVQGERPGTWEPIGYGELKWRKALMQASPERLARIEARIKRWNELERGIA